MSAVLDRATFATSRTLEYFTQKELRAQIGLDTEFWPLAILRELIDNALDACEECGVLPDIEISTENDTIVVTDNGPGIPPETIARSLDYLVRVSSKAFYISPTRGAMGNAMKVIWAAPFVATGGGSVEITTRGERHTVTVSLDRIAQRPDISHNVVRIDGFDTGDSPSLVDAKAIDSYHRGGRVQSEAVKIGTSIKIAWTDATRLLNEPDDDSYRSTAADLVAGFAAFNPHASITLDGRTYSATVTGWSKWSPTAPTSAHWYTDETLRDLIAAYLNRDRDTGGERTVRKFVGEFRGLSSTAKRKAVTEGWSGHRLQDFVVDGDVDPDFVRELLSRMQAVSSAPPPKALGIIGKEHLTAWMVAHGVSRDSIRYSKKAATDELPFVLEIAFGINEDDESTRRIVTGLNWSPVIGGDPDLTLRKAVSEARLDPHDPVTLVVHIARPRFQFADRGKTRLTPSSGDVAKAIASATKAVTKAWKREKQRADRNDRVASNRIARLRYRPPRVTIREIAFEEMEAAYMKASAGGKYFANARQIMYAARPAILGAIDAAQFDDKYFTQTLLKDYLEEYRPDWKVVWDARGHLVEPHTGTKIGLGGAEVERYTEQWRSVIECREKPGIKINVDTHGPDNRFSSVLFVEKEGFSEILADAGIGERYDMAIMSTKGVPVKAACEVIAAMHREGVRTFVLRDFDLSGFKIVRTLKNGVRLSSGSPVVDLGLRLNDVEGLPAEPDEQRSKVDPRSYLQYECDATDDEAAFLVSGGYPGRWRGERVEINAMTSDQLIAWLEAKFEEHGIQKMVPEANTLNDAYRRAVFLKRMQAEIAELESAMRDDDTAIPKQLSARVKARLKKNPAMSWDQAVWELADDDAAT